MKSTNQQLISKSIDILRFPLAVMVVAIHTYFNEALKARGNVDVPFSGEWAHAFIRLFSITLTDCAVPLFFVISGYLYFLKTPHLTKEIYIEKTRKKCVSLLVPFFCWSILACVMEPSRFLQASTMEKVTGFWSTTMHLWEGSGPWDGPLWFMRDLFVVMLFAPILEYLVRKVHIFSILIFLIPCYCGVTNIVPGLSFLSFGYFMIGAFIAIKDINIVSCMKGWYVVPVGVLFFVLRCFSYGALSQYASPINNLWILASMALYTYIAVNIAKHTKDMTTWKKLAASGFVIYAMHRLFNSKVSALGLMFIGKPSLSGIEAVALYVATILITVCVCYWAHLIIIRNKYLTFLLEGSRR